MPSAERGIDSRDTPGTLRLTASTGVSVFKSSEERATARREREAEQARAQAALAEQAQQEEERRRRAAFLATPVGAATAAKEAGQTFFETQLEVGTHSGRAGFGSADGERTTTSSAVTLGEIEQLGWHLEHVGYYFMITGQTSTDRVFVTGEATAVSGVTFGVYLFRNTALTDASPPG
jgi:multidrug efflux pump subunit AcrA (membrane-fusion protein)